MGRACVGMPHTAPCVSWERGGGSYRHMLLHLGLTLHMHSVLAVMPLSSLYSKEYCRTDLQSNTLLKVHTLKVLPDPVLR